LEEAMRTLLMVAALMAAPTYEKPTLTVRVFPPIQLADTGFGGASVMMTAELHGPETEKFYCPKVTWEFPDGTTAVHEQDCAPFENRHECYPALAKDCGVNGFRLNLKTGEYEDTVKECACNITGYPNLWRRSIAAPAHPEGEYWEVWVRLDKNGKMLARQNVRFWIK